MNSVLCYKCNKKATKHKRKQVLFIPMGFCGKVRNHAGTIGKKEQKVKRELTNGKILRASCYKRPSSW